MLFRRWLHSTVYAPDDGGSGGDGGTSTTVNNTPPPNNNTNNNSGGNTEGSGRRQTESELRAEAASWRVEYRKAQDRIRELETKNQDTETAVTKKVEDAVKPLNQRLEKMHTRLLDTAIRHELVSAGLMDPDLIGLRSQMPNAPEVKIDDNGEVVGTKELVEAFKKWKPGFFGSAGAGNGASSGGSGTGAGAGASGGNGAGGSAGSGNPRAGSTGAASPPAAPSLSTGNTSVKGLNPEAYRRYKLDVQSAIKANRPIPQPPTA